MSEKLFLDDASLQAFDAVVREVTPQGVVLDRTAFYAASGGQPGDIGVLAGVPVTDTIKDREVPDRIIHVVADPSRFAVGDAVQGQIDWHRRWQHMRMHTALHLLCSLIKGDVTGGAIGADKSRLDFNIEAGDVNKDELTAKLNELIAADHKVTTALIDEAELDANPTLVRTLSVKPPRGSGMVRMVTIGDTGDPVDRQPCGGTHVESTGQIGPVQVAKIENKGRMNKRITLTLVEEAAQEAA